MMMSISSLTVTSLPIISSAFCAYLFFALAAADAVFIAVDEVLHFAVFRPIMNSRRADADAVAAVNAFVRENMTGTGYSALPG